jgi:putative membrane protein
MGSDPPVDAPLELEDDALTDEAPFSAEFSAELPAGLPAGPPAELPAGPPAGPPAGLPAELATPDAPAAASTEARDTPWRSLHPASLVVNLVPQAWRTIRGAWPLLLALFFGGAGMGVEVFDLSLLLAFFAVALTRTTVHFLTLRYRVHEGRLEFRHGLLNRQARALDPARIQNVSLNRNVFHRISGLVEVRVETAGDASTTGMLSALSTEAAEALQAELKTLVGGAEPEPLADAEAGEAEAPPPLVRVGVLELLAYGLSRRTVGTVAVITAVGMELMARLGPEGADQVRWVAQPRVLAAAVMLAFCASWIWSAGTALFRHWGFTLRRTGDRLHSSEGLATIRSVEIPLRKVQIVQVVEPLLRRLMGYGSVLIETAALGFADGRVRQAEGVVPMVAHEELPGIVRAAAPLTDVDPWTMALLPAHPRALYRAVVQRAVRLTLLCGLVAWVVDPVGFWAFAGVSLALPLAWLDWRWQRWAVTPQAIVARRGFLTRRTWVIARDKLQSVHVHQTLVMRWHRLGRVEVRVAGTEVSLPDVHIDQALDIWAQLRDTHTPDEPAEA